MIISDAQFGASPTDDSRVVIYDRNMFIIQATGVNVKKLYFFIHYGVSK
jgi:hypothetical protein